MNKTILSCTSCGYPVAVTSSGEQIRCAYCSNLMETIEQPFPRISGSGTVVGILLAFGIGVLVGPAFLSATREGQQYLKQYTEQQMWRLK